MPWPRALPRWGRLLGPRASPLSIHDKCTFWELVKVYVSNDKEQPLRPRGRQTRFICICGAGALFTGRKTTQARLR